MIELTDVAYVRSGAADLDKAVAFATEIVGLELVIPPGAEGKRQALLRADGRHHCLALVEGRSGVLASGFTVASEGAPEGFTYEYSFGVRRIEDDAAWRPRTFDPGEPGSIDMWLRPQRRPVTQPQVPHSD